ncbi:pilus assembly PilX N-terminal domain-containing protein [Deinococcus sp. MIMF12]|uniref:Pilus assembly PilX N-terminal domain-containing protein n=1 Tax=Deinococcus rhizophilus TaxID=3049544 RepID=A0ABT7JGF7_9DEIO|nr:pilus assembly PilX N-terminal domain-containing protein [Deinococcus rhizophilus]MDL2344036.1 pilus assembly PilX N-terminal domain-containing protein [Deinococcus rhizophilus]
MSVHVLRPRRRRREEGIALVVVLLFTAVVLTIVVSTTATLALGARGGGVNERAAYQALLAAESGLNTFEARVKALGKYPGNGTQSVVNQWWTDNPNLKDYGDAELEVTAKPGGKEITVTSTGRVLGGTKIAVQDYSLAVDKGFKFRPRSAVTSIPPIDATGSASVGGKANDGVVAKVRDSTINLAAGTTTVTLPLNSPIGTNTSISSDEMSGLLVGDYIKVSGVTFRIDSKSETSVTVTRVPAASATVLPLTGNVTLMLNAVASSYTTVADPMRIEASNFGDFVVGEKVTIGGKEAVVTKVGPNENEPEGEYIDIDWVGTQPTTLPEGTQILRDITALRSASTIQVPHNKTDAYAMDGDPDCTASGNGNNAVITCEAANDPLLNQNIAENETFFTNSIFGVSDSKLDEIVPLETDVSSDFQMNGEIRRIRAADLEIAIKNKTSSGILIVDGDVNWTGGGSSTFNGFIYFRGNQGGKLNGNLTVSGGIAVRGGPIEGINSGDDLETDLTGNLTVNYQATALRRYFINNGEKKIKPIQGTWRQQ